MLKYSSILEVHSWLSHGVKKIFVDYLAQSRYSWASMFVDLYMWLKGQIKPVHPINRLCSFIRLVLHSNLLFTLKTVVSSVWTIQCVFFTEQFVCSLNFSLQNVAWNVVFFLVGIQLAWLQQTKHIVQLNYLKVIFRMLTGSTSTNPVNILNITF